MTDDRKRKAGGADAALDFTAQLRGKQSVRTTFKLTEGTIHAVSIVAAHLGIKQKSLFDQLMEDLDQMGGMASLIKKQQPTEQQRVQKTYVVSRRSLDSLEQIAREYKASRDMLVELSVKRLLPLIEQERLQHEKRKAVLAELDSYLERGVALLSETRRLLGDEDRVTERIASAVYAAKQAQQEVAACVAKGKIIEDF